MPGLDYSRAVAGATGDAGNVIGQAAGLAGLIPIPFIGGIVGGLGTAFSSVFGSDDGPVTPGVVNPATGQGVRCGKQDENERVDQMESGNYAWLLARMGGRNYYDRPEIIPFPNGRTPDEVGANIMAALMQTDRGGQCPRMTQVAAQRYAYHMAQIKGGNLGRGGKPIDSASSQFSFGPGTPQVQSAGFGMDLSGGVGLLLLGLLIYGASR